VYLGVYGYVQVCVLSSELFNDTPEDHIRDIRPRPAHGRRYYRCRDCHRLIETLVDVLLAYDAYGRGHVRSDRVVQSLESLRPFVDGVVTLRRQRMLTNKKLRTLKPQDVLGAYALLQQVAQGMSPADYAKIPERAEAPSSAYTTLLQRMDEAFLVYGPVRYPANAVDYAKALLLRSLGVEPNMALKSLLVGIDRIAAVPGSPSPPDIKWKERLNALSTNLNRPSLSFSSLFL
jgi:hypothetical protein